METSITLTPIDLNDNELNIKYSNSDQIQNIYKNCILPLFEKKQLRVHHMPSILIALAQIDKAICEINDKIRYQLNGKRRLALAKINKLHEQNKVLRETIRNLSILLEDPNLKGHSISNIYTQIAEYEKEILDNNEMIEIYKLSQEYKVYDWDKMHGNFTIPKSDDFVKSAMVILKNIGLTIEGSKFLEAELDATIISMFTNNMLDE